MYIFPHRVTFLQLPAERLASKCQAGDSAQCYSASALLRRKAEKGEEKIICILRSNLLATSLLPSYANQWGTQLLRHRDLDHGTVGGAMHGTRVWVGLRDCGCKSETTLNPFFPQRKYFCYAIYTQIVICSVGGDSFIAYCCPYGKSLRTIIFFPSPHLVFTLFNLTSLLHLA